MGEANHVCLYVCVAVDQGKLAEYDEPMKLLDKPDGDEAIFKSMVTVTGLKQAARLRHLAETKDVAALLETLADNEDYSDEEEDAGAGAGAGAGTAAAAEAPTTGTVDDA